MSKVRVSGFSIVRNAFLLEYPLEESLLSLLPLCDELILNCGDSEDRTVEFCEDFAKKHSKVKVIRTVWTQDKQSGGFQLKAQTDLALSHCSGEWCFYLQSDEVLHQDDYPILRDAMERADNFAEVDGIIFNYLHFYGSYRYTIRGRNWYRREVRLFKNNRGIAAFRDAQGFRKNGSRLLAIPTSARVFHYGYVRSSTSLQVKSSEMAKWWGEKPPDSHHAFQLKRHVGLSLYRGTHPSTMEKRILQTIDSFDPAQCPRVWDKKEIKNALTLLWESVIPYRIGEFRNFDVKPF